MIDHHLPRSTRYTLALRAVATRRWDWCHDHGEMPRTYPLSGGPLPDFSDPGALGWLVLVVEAAVQGRPVWVAPGTDRGGWVCWCQWDDGRRAIGDGDSRIEALVAALERLP